MRVGSVGDGVSREIERATSQDAVGGYAPLCRIWLPILGLYVIWLLAMMISIPDLADLCLIRMSELYPRHMLITVDTDFRVYRRNKREAIPAIYPPKLLS
jgi:hypothetical protein